MPLAYTLDDYDSFTTSSILTNLGWCTSQCTSMQGQTKHTVRSNTATREQHNSTRGPLWHGGSCVHLSLQPKATEQPCTRSQVYYACRLKPVKATSCSRHVRSPSPMDTSRGHEA